MHQLQGLHTSIIGSPHPSIPVPTSHLASLPTLHIHPAAPQRLTRLPRLVLPSLASASMSRTAALTMGCSCCSMGRSSVLAACRSVWKVQGQAGRQGLSGKHAGPTFPVDPPWPLLLPPPLLLRPDLPGTTHL